MTADHLKRAGAAIAILVLVAAAVWLLLPHGKDSDNGGTLKVVPVAPVAPQAPEVLNEKLERHTKQVTKGLADLRRGHGTLADGTGWTYERGALATSADVITVDGGTVSADDGDDRPQAAPATLKLRFEQAPTAEAVQAAVRELLSDDQAQITAAGKIWKLSSDKLVAADIAADGRTVSLDGVFLKTDCDDAERFRPSMQLAAACQITPRFPRYDGPTKKFPRPKLTEAQREERVAAPEGATPPATGLERNGKPYNPKSVAGSDR